MDFSQLQFSEVLGAIQGLQGTLDGLSQKLLWIPLLSTLAALLFSLLVQWLSHRFTLKRDLKARESEQQAKRRDLHREKLEHAILELGTLMTWSTEVKHLVSVRYAYDKPKRMENIPTEEFTEKFIKEVLTHDRSFSAIAMVYAMEHAEQFAAVKFKLAEFHRQIADAIEYVSNPAAKVQEIIAAVSKSQADFHDSSNQMIRALRDTIRFKYLP